MGVGGASIITGERLQALADVTLITEEVHRFHLSLPGVKTKLVFFGGASQRVLCWDELPPELQQAQIFFVYTHLLKDFFRSIFPALVRPLVLITHNSDHCIGEEYLPCLDEERLVVWYAQNVGIDHEKLISLPIGLANAQWKHGAVPELVEVVGEDVEKTNLLYVNFDTSTNVAARQGLFEKLAAEKFATLGERKPFGAYLREMSAHRFCAAPAGNGLDSHRTWECLYLGVIPILERDLMSRHFSDLPILFVEDWEEVTEGFLNRAYQEMATRTFDRSKLELGYWRRRVQESRIEALKRV